ncbi:Uncharacterised protein [Escherichia coli]|nr:Uncharacterised protein [Escherichia coli]
MFQGDLFAKAKIEWYPFHSGGQRKNNFQHILSHDFSKSS